MQAHILYFMIRWLEILGLMANVELKLASSLLPQQILYFPSYLFTHFDKPKNSLQLPHSTRNIRKCSNKLMNNTSGEIYLQNKQDIICQVKKVKLATSAHYVVDVILFLAYIKFPSNQRFDIARKMYFNDYIGFVYRL